MTLFDLSNPLDFFKSICSSFDDYKRDKNKKIEKLLYVVMGLNHLREWIAPGYNLKGGKWRYPSKPEEIFSRDIYDNCKEFDVIRGICNHTKHWKNTPLQTMSENEDRLFQWESLSNVKHLSKGVVINYTVDGQNVEDIIQPTIDYYNQNWFSRNP